MDSNSKVTLLDEVQSHTHQSNKIFAASVPLEQEVLKLRNQSSACLMRVYDLFHEWYNTQYKDAQIKSKLNIESHVVQNKIIGYTLTYSVNGEPFKTEVSV